eukprot:scaffold16536_cov42-Tisochrysis_lutea.AAC.6
MVHNPPRHEGAEEVAFPTQENCKRPVPERPDNLHFGIFKEPVPLVRVVQGCGYFILSAHGQMCYALIEEIWLTCSIMIDKESLCMTVGLLSTPFSGMVMTALHSWLNLTYMYMYVEDDSDYVSQEF